MFNSSALLRIFLTSNFKKDDKYLAPPEIFFVPSPGCVGLATALLGAGDTAASPSKIFVVKLIRFWQN